MGLIVHPVNSPPRISLDHLRLKVATGGSLLVDPYQDLHLAGVLRLSDPDEEDFSNWFAKRTHVARLELRASCGSLSFEILDPSVDYVAGVQNGSIAGHEGLTFHDGDGMK